MDKVNLTTLRQNLGDVIGRVQYGRQEITVTRRGTPVAVISPLNVDDSPPSDGDDEHDGANGEA